MNIALLVIIILILAIFLYKPQSRANDLSSSGGGSGDGGSDSSSNTTTSTSTTVATTRSTTTTTLGPVSKTVTLSVGQQIYDGSTAYNGQTNGHFIWNFGQMPTDIGTITNVQFNYAFNQVLDQVTVAFYTGTPSASSVPAQIQFIYYGSGVNRSSDNVTLSSTDHASNNNTPYYQIMQNNLGKPVSLSVYGGNATHVVCNSASMTITYYASN